MASGSAREVDLTPPLFCVLMWNYSLFRKGCNSGNHVFALRIVKYGHGRLGVAQPRWREKAPPKRMLRSLKYVIITDVSDFGVVVETSPRK